MEDGSRFSYDMASLTEGYTQRLVTLVNKANAGTYDMIQATSGLRLVVDCESLNHNSSLRNLGNGYTYSGYFPKSGAVTVGFYMKTPATIATTKTLFGTNDASNHRLGFDMTSAGQFQARIGNNSSILASGTYTTSTVYYVVIRASGTSLDMWVNGTQVITAAAYTFSGTSSTQLLFHCGGSTVSNTPSQYWNEGYLGDFVLLERSISDSELASLHAYFAARVAARVTYKEIPIFGDSLAAGFNTGVDYTSAANEQPNHRIRQVRRVTNDGLVIPATVPLQNKTANDGAVGAGFRYAKKLLAAETDPNVCYLLVPCAQSGSGIVGAAAEWKTPSGARYTEAITRVNAALGKGVSASLHSAILSIGTNDKGGGYTTATYKVELDALINGLRSGITGGTNLKFLMTGQVDPQVDAVIEPALSDTPNRLSNVKFQALTGIPVEADNTHPTGAGARTIDDNHYANFLTM